MFPITKTPALTLKEVFNGVLSGSVYPAPIIPPSMPVSIMRTFEVFASFTEPLFVIHQFSIIAGVSWPIRK